MSGLDQISVVVAGYAGVVVLASAVAGLRLHLRPTWLDSMVWFLEVLAAVRVTAGVGALLSGHHAREPEAYVGYLIASVCIIPIALSSFRPPTAAEAGARSGPGTDGAEVPGEPTGGPAGGPADGAAVEEDRGVWSVGVVAVSALAVGVIAVRTMMTL